MKPFVNHSRRWYRDVVRTRLCAGITIRIFAVSRATDRPENSREVSQFRYLDRYEVGRAVLCPHLPDIRKSETLSWKISRIHETH